MGFQVGPTNPAPQGDPHIRPANRGPVWPGLPGYQPEPAPGLMPGEPDTHPVSPHDLNPHFIAGGQQVQTGSALPVFNFLDP